MLQWRLPVGLVLLAALTAADGAHAARGQAAVSTSSAPVVLGNAYLRLAFDRRTGSVVSIRVRSPGARGAEGDEFLGAHDSSAVLWRLIFEDSTGRSDTVDNVHAGAPAFTRSRSELVVSWPSVRAPSGVPMRVTARVHLAESDSSAELRLAAVPADVASGGAGAG
ncbi:MAG: hypothetical protein IRY91_17370, partial [Gemmatimonadaceae bacterium]|nr:hypothetical protein [Gemmatimonadaceae bacterium]